MRLYMAREIGVCGGFDDTADTTVGEAVDAVVESENTHNFRSPVR